MEGRPGQDEAPAAAESQDPRAVGPLQASEEVWPLCDARCGAPTLATFRVGKSCPFRAALRRRPSRGAASRGPGIQTGLSEKKGDLVGAFLGPSRSQPVPFPSAEDWRVGADSLRPGSHLFSEMELIPKLPCLAQLY